MVLDLEAELLGDRLEPLVVVAALAAGVLDAAPVRERVRGLVQQRRQHRPGAAGEALAADEDLRERAALLGLPAIGREVPEPQAAARCRASRRR